MPFRSFVLVCLGTVFYLSTHALWTIVWVALGIALEICYHLWSRKTRQKLKSETNFTSIRLWNDSLTVVILVAWTTGTYLFHQADVPSGKIASLLILTGIGTNLAYQPSRFLIFSIINAAIPGGLIIILSLLDISQPGGWLQLFVGCLMAGAIVILVFVTRHSNKALYLSLAQQMTLIDALAKANDEADSKRRHAESLAKTKADFIAVMSHEVRTPLNGVLGMAETLARSNLDEDQKQQVSTIVDSGHLLLKIASNILDLSMNETGHLQLENAAVDLDNMIDAGLNLWRKRAEEKGLKFLVERADNVPRLIASDSTRLRQVLFNLIENAIKFTKDGEVALHILRENKAPESDMLRFLVSDTGIGIEPSHHKKIFERFYKVESKATRNSDGAGLGLAIVQELVELMGGQITLQSMPNEGSIFAFTIPCQPLPEHKDNAPQATSSQPAWSRGHDKNLPPRFLVVDDNLINHRVLDAILAPYLSDNVTAMSGKEAIEAYETKGPFTLVFMDMRMPGMDGVEAIKRIRAMENTVHTPILALTANVNQSDENACMDAGADAFLTKPLDINRVYAMVSLLIGYDVPNKDSASGDCEILHAE